MKRPPAFQCWIHGHETQGSKRIGRNRATGKAILLEANGRLKAWRSCLSDCMHAAAQGRPPLDSAVVVRLVVYVQRPKDHYGTGRNADRLKPAARALTYAPAGDDLDKIQRAVGDAGTGIWWTDDRRIAAWEVHRLYLNDPAAEETTHVYVWPIPGP